MVRSEITSFNLICGEVARACTPPFSLCSAEGAELPSGSFSAVFTLAPTAQDFKYEYIRLTDLVGLTEVRLSGEVIHSTPFTGRVLNLNIKDKVKQGENTLELVFSQTAGSHLCAGLFGKAELLMFSGAVIDRVGVKQSFEGGFATGHTAEFLEVACPSDRPLHAELRTVKLTGRSDDRLFGVLED